ncbi:MAG: alpha/beta hydrolase [Mycobacteriales bacterium]
MRTEPVTFYSDGYRLAGLWRTKDGIGDGMPAVVQGPGWLGLKDAKLYLRYHQALTDAGFGVLIFDYRGFGESQGPRDLDVPGQLRDLRNAVTYLTTRPDVSADAIGAFGSGGTGGGNAVLLAAVDPRVRAVVSQVPVADGRDWLHRMRSEDEWLAFLGALAEDAKERVLTGRGRMVHPREEIMVPTGERRTTAVKSDVDERVPELVALAAARDILDYQPRDAAARLTTPLMVVAVENDATTPTDHAVGLYQAAKGPKRLIMQHNTTHYGAYDKYWESVTPQIVDWFRRFLVPAAVTMRSADCDHERCQILEESE